ncbi:MAG: hypothetical protein LLG01_00170 [Planctomycetaceae bacterium]|nr:hypothetical protein [Planctomycetaceae bacterium]
MNRTLTAVLVLLAVVAVSMPALAQDQGDNKPAVRQRGERMPMMRVLNDEQKAILKAAREEAAKADTPEKKAEINKAAMEKVKASLTDDQKAKIKAAEAQRGQRGPGMRGMGDMEKVLTDDQKATLKTAGDEAAKADTPQKKREIMKAAMDKVQASLTQEQKDQIAKARSEREAKSREAMDNILNDDQKAVMKTARDEAAKTEDAQKKRDIMRAAMEKVRSTMTEDQKAQMEKLRPARHGPGRRGAQPKTDQPAPAPAPNE